jgi:hypothetical protein
LTVVLAIAAITSGIGVPLALSFVFDASRTTLNYTAAYLTGDARRDSWYPLRVGLEQIRRDPTRPVYSTLFPLRDASGGADCRTCFKLQYSPATLWILERVRTSPFGDLTLDGPMNAAAAVAVPLIALLVFATFRTSLAQALDRSPGGWLETALQFALALFFTLTFYPVVRAAYLGQAQIWVDLLFAGVVLAWMRTQRLLAGVMCGSLTLVKPTLGLLVVWALARRQWRFLIGWTLPVAAVGLASVAAYGWGQHFDYLRFLSFASRHGESFYANQSVNGLLHRALANGLDDIWSEHFYAPYHPLVHAGTVLATVILIGGALFWRGRQTVRSEKTDLLLASLSMTAAAPIAWDHHYGVALPIFAAILPAIATSAFARIGLPLLGLSYVTMSNEIRPFYGMGGSAWGLFQSYLFFAALLLVVLLHVLRIEQQHSPTATGDPTSAART